MLICMASLKCVYSCWWSLESALCFLSKWWIWHILLSYCVFWFSSVFFKYITELKDFVYHAPTKCAMQNMSKLLCTCSNYDPDNFFLSRGASTHIYMLLRTVENRVVLLCRDHWAESSCCSELSVASVWFSRGWSGQFSRSREPGILMKIQAM